LCTGLTAPAGAVSGHEPPRWSRCAQDKPETFECATVRVPLDYAHPDSGTIDIAISRVKATNPDARRGVLLLNPGGPGSSGLTMPVTKQFPEEVTERYDLIGFDPRGIGASTPVTCGLGDGKGWSPIQFDRARFDEHVEQTREIARQCWTTEPKLLPHITTRNTARDLDAIRMALGERKISYYGASYGTYLGAVYTQLFPRRSDRIVLDSNVDPDRVWRGMIQIWTLPAERAFDMFAVWAAERDETYGLGTTVAEVRDTFRQLLNRLDRTPVTVDGQTYDGNRVRLAARGIGQHEEINVTLADLLRKLLAAQGQPATTAVAAPPADNRPAALLAIMCGDARWPTDVDQYLRDAIRDTQRYPMMGGQTSNISPCAFWPDPKEPPTKIRDNKAESILLVQSSHETQTPVEGALNLRRLLPDNARIALAEGSWRHGVYPGHCTDGTVTHYLVTGELPAEDVTCRQ
jgi:pimeloyl-ACP methyl ester carboxylesterase